MDEIETEQNEISEKKIFNTHLGLAIFVVLDLIVIMIGDRPPDQGFLEYCAWMTIGLGNVVIIFVLILLGIGWAV